MNDLLARDFKGFFAIAGAKSLKALRLQDLFQRIQLQEIVVGQQN